MPHSPQRTSAAGLYEATGKGGALWCMGSCSQMFYHADGGMLDKYGYRTYREKKIIICCYFTLFYFKGKTNKLSGKYPGVNVYVPAPRCEALQLSEDTHSISCSLDDICLRQNVLSKCLKQQRGVL